MLTLADIGILLAGIVVFVSALWVFYPVARGRDAGLAAAIMLLSPLVGTTYTWDWLSANFTHYSIIFIVFFGFSSMGFILIGSLYRWIYPHYNESRWRIYREELAKKAHLPDTPIIPASSINIFLTAVVILVCVFAILSWMSIPNKSHNAVPTLYFAAALVALYVGSVYALRWKRYGRPYIELENVPARLGTRMKGLIMTRLTDLPPNGFTLTLYCRRLERVGSRSVDVRVLWECTHTVPFGALQIREKLYGIPFAFDLPLHPAARATFPYPPIRVAWELKATAAMPGVDFKESFEVIVRRDQQAPVIETEKGRRR